MKVCRLKGPVRGVIDMWTKSADREQVMSCSGRATTILGAKLY